MSRLHRGRAQSALSASVTWGRRWPQTLPRRDIGSLPMSVVRIRWASSLGSVSRPTMEFADLFDCEVVISMLPDDAAVRDVVFGREDARGSRIGIEARRNSSFHEHNQHRHCVSPRGGACPLRARLRRGAGLWKSGCRQGAPALHRRRRRSSRCRALSAAVRQPRTKDICRRRRCLRTQTSSSCSAT